MTREQIIKALECFHIRVLETKLAEQIYEEEIQAIISAIALIRELTDECDRLRNKPPFAKISFDTEIVEQLAKEKLAEFELDIEAIRTETVHLMVEKLKARLPVISPSVFENIARDVLEE